MLAAQGFNFDCYAHQRMKSEFLSKTRYLTTDLVPHSIYERLLCMNTPSGTVHKIISGNFKIKAGNSQKIRLVH